MIILRWARWGVYCDQTHLYIRKGLFGVDALYAHAQNPTK